MREQCRTFRDHLAQQQPGQTMSFQPALSQHVRQCPQCRAQQDAHQAMSRALAGLELPQPHREEEVMHRIRAQRRAQAASQVSSAGTPRGLWRWRILLAAYWLAAGAVCFWLLASRGARAASWAADHGEWLAPLWVPLAGLLLAALPYLRRSLRRLFLSLAATPGRSSR